MTAPVPIEVIRDLADTHGRATLIRHFELRGEIYLGATFELTPHGFMALVGYRTPDNSLRHEVPVMLTTTVRESAG